MARKPRVQAIEIDEDEEGRFRVQTYEDNTVMRRRVEKGAAPRRKPRKPFARAWRPTDRKEP
jgi:hypothetical protein